MSFHFELPVAYLWSDGARYEARLGHFEAIIAPHDDPDGWFMARPSGTASFRLGRYRVFLTNRERWLAAAGAAS